MGTRQGFWLLLFLVNILAREIKEEKQMVEELGEKK